jgi:acetolactate synthase I/II/III large subunit
MYPRIVGILPACRKVVLTSNVAAVEKNGYLQSSDIVVVGEVQDALRQLSECLVNGKESLAAGSSVQPQAAEWFPSKAPTQLSDMAIGLARAVARGFATAPKLVLMDDSQTFGGLMALNYSHLPPQARVFGSHGGFVGSGLAKAIGLAVVHSDSSVVAVLGDQGLTNGVQALAALQEQQAPLLVLVCNNGASVSLAQQAAADGVSDMIAPALVNVSGLSYAAIAQGFGLSASTHYWLGDESHSRSRTVSQMLTDHIAEVLTTRQVHVLELITPSAPDFWRGIWNVAGYEER